MTGSSVELALRALRAVEHQLVVGPVWLVIVSDSLTDYREVDRSIALARL